MIENHRQYRITKREADRFRAALDCAESKRAEAGSSDRLRRASREALESQLDDLRAELSEFEARTAPGLSAAPGVPLRSFDALAPIAIFFGILAYCWVIYDRQSIQPGGHRLPIHPKSLAGYAATLMGILAGFWLRPAAVSEAGAGHWWRRISKTVASPAFSLAALVAPAIFATLIDAQELMGGSIRAAWFAFANGAACAGLSGSMLRTSTGPTLADRSSHA